MSNNEQAEEREYFPFYLSFEKAISNLDEKDQLLIYRAIARYSLFGEEPPQLERFARATWELLLPILNKSRRKYQNGKKGGAPKGNQNSRKQPENNLKTTKKQANNKIIKQVNNKILKHTQEENRKNSVFYPAPTEPQYHLIKKAWNETCVNLSSITAIKGNKRNSRKAAVRSALNHIAETYVESANFDDYLQFLYSIFLRVNASHFCCGDNPRGWKVTFDYVMKPENIDKIFEGNFDNVEEDTGYIVSAPVSDNCDIF